MAVSLKSAAQIEHIRESAQYVGRVLQALGDAVEPGVSTGDLDDLAESLCREWGVVPAFKGMYGFPNAVCISVNEEVVHGIPAADRVLQEGDIVSTDFGIISNGYFGDAARTWAVGQVSDEARELMDVTRESLERAIAQCVPGKRIGDIGHAVQSFVEPAGYSVVRDYVGHGIGRKLHEDPQVPNYGRPGRGERIKAGMVVALEPMICVGGPEVVTLEDEWTVVTKDRRLSAHFEDTVAVTEDGPVVLSRVDGSHGGTP